QSQVRSNYHESVELFAQAMRDTTATSDAPLRAGPIYIANVTPTAPQTPQWQAFGTLVACGTELCFGSAAGGPAARQLMPVRSSYGVPIGIETRSDPNILLYSGHALVI